MYDSNHSTIMPAEAPLARSNANLYAVPLRRQLQNWVYQLRKQGMALVLMETLDQLRRLVMGAPSRRFTKITPQLYVGGQHFRHGLAALRRRGVSAMVNLRAEADDRARQRAVERYLHLPVIDRTPPTLEQLEQGVAFIGAEIANGGTVYVHCREGIGRAPTLAAAYLVSTGLAPDEAWEQIRAVRPFIRPTPMQIRQIEQFAERREA